MIASAFTYRVTPLRLPEGSPVSKAIRRGPFWLDGVKRKAKGQRAGQGIRLTGIRKKDGVRRFVDAPLKAVSQFLQRNSPYSPHFGTNPDGPPCAPDHGMATISSFRDLLVWQKSIDLAVRCHTLAKRFPRDEQPVLGFQIRKSALSMPSNVAEGFARHSTASYIQHLWTAHASGAELQTQIEVGRRIEVVAERDAEALIADAQELGRMLYGLVKSLDRAR